MALPVNISTESQETDT